MLAFYLILAWIPLEPGPDWVIRGTEIYQPLQPGEVIVTSNGDSLILDFPNAMIIRFGTDGQKANIIGFKGRGPGGLTYPMNFFLENDSIYVHDLIDNSINSFQLDGKFLKKTACPNQNLDLVKVAGGWVYASWRSSRNHAGDPQVFWADNQFAHSRKLLELKATGERGGLSMEIENGVATAIFSPISSAPLLAFSADHSRIYIAEAKGFKIHVIDGKNGTVIRTIARTERAIPFDQAWGDTRLKGMQESMKARGHNMKVTKNYPENFPIIRAMNVLPNGTLVVDRWRGNPDEKHWVVAFDANGQKQDLDWSWEAVERVVGSYKELANRHHSRR